MNHGNEANEIRALARLLEKGYVYRGLKPVNWCFDCRSALAEAEVEYQDRRDPEIDVGFPFAEQDKIATAFGLDKLPSDKGYAVIWTTTPWTIPANQALNVHPEFDYALVETEKGLLIVAEERAKLPSSEEGRTLLQKRYGLNNWKILATAKGAALEGIRFKHPL